VYDEVPAADRYGTKRSASRVVASRPSLIAAARPATLGGEVGNFSLMRGTTQANTIRPNSAPAAAGFVHDARPIERGAAAEGCR